MAKDLCSVNMPNGGAPECDRSRGIPRYIIIGSGAFLAAHYASQAAFKARFKELCLKGRDEAGKLIVLPIIKDIQNTTEADKEGTLNQGFKEKLQEGYPGFAYGVKISNYQAQILRTLNKQDVKVLTVDDAKAAWGTYHDSDASFGGESATIFTGGDNFSDGQNSKVVVIGIAYTDVAEFKDASKYFDLNFNVADYGRLKDVVIYEKAAQAANVFKLSGKILTGKLGKSLDVYTDHAAALAAGGNWRAYDEDGNAIAITSVAQNAAGYWVVTLDATAYGNVASGKTIYINLAYPSVLDGAGVTGIEGVAFSVVKP